MGRGLSARRRLSDSVLLCDEFFVGRCGAKSGDWLLRMGWSLGKVHLDITIIVAFGRVVMCTLCFDA